MKKYYFKTNNTIYTNDENVPGYNKQVTGCYSGNYYSVNMDNKIAPWFCMKDGRYPLYKISRQDNYDFIYEFIGYRKMFDFTISSISGKYTLKSDFKPNDEYTFISKVPYIKKIDMVLNGENIFDVFNLNSGSKLKWKMKEELISSFNSDEKGPSYWDSNLGFLYDYKVKDSNSIAQNVIGYGVQNNSYNILDKNMMTFTNIIPTVTMSSQNLQAQPKLHGTEEQPGTFNNYIPPHFTLKKSQFPDNYNSIKIKLEGIFLHSNFSNPWSSYEPDNSLIYNTGTFNSGYISNNCLGFIYQTNNNSKWTWSNNTPSETTDYLNGNYSATFNCVYEDNQIKLFNKNDAITIYRTYCINDFSEDEIQDFKNPKIWDNIFIYNVNSSFYDNVHHVSLYHFDSPYLTGYTYLTDEDYSHFNEVYKLTKIENSYSNFNTASFLSSNNKIDNLNGELVDFSANDRFIIYSHKDFLNYSHYYGYDKMVQKIEPYYDVNNLWNQNEYSEGKFSALYSINDNYIKNLPEASNVWKWNNKGNSPLISYTTKIYNNNYDLSDVILEYKIPKSSISGDYLHISYPITTILNGATDNSGLVIEYNMSYEFI